MKPFKKYGEEQLGDLLIKRGILTEERLKIALQKQKEKNVFLGQILVSMSYAGEKEIAQTLAIQYALPYLQLENCEIDEEAVKAIPKSVAEEYNLIPTDKMGKILTVAISNPVEPEVFEDIELMTNCNLQIFVSTISSITKAIEKAYHITHY